MIYLIVYHLYINLCDSNFCFANVLSFVSSLKGFENLL